MAVNALDTLMPGARLTRRAAPRLSDNRGAATATLFAAKECPDISRCRSTVPFARGNLFEWRKKLKAVIERQHLDRGEAAEPGVISIFEVYRSVLHADHRGDRPSLSLA